MGTVEAHLTMVRMILMCLVLLYHCDCFFIRTLGRFGGGLQHRNSVARYPWRSSYRHRRYHDDDYSFKPYYQQSSYYDQDVAEEHGESNGENNLTYGKKFAGVTIISKIRAKNSQVCLRRCKTINGCVAVNWKKKKCVLLSSYKNVKARKGWIAGKV